MKVQIGSEVVNGHSVEIGVATWDDGNNCRSVRNRYLTASGGFSPHSSSEIPIEDLVPILCFVAQNDALSVADCAEIIQALGASIGRQHP